MENSHLNQQSKEYNFRYERKFSCLKYSNKEIEAIIKNNSYNFKEIFYERQVNSIYFDCPKMKNYLNNLNGVANRLKVRIRWYEKNLKLAKNPVLEIKLKEGDLGKKLSFNLPDFKIETKKLKQEILNKIKIAKIPQLLKEEMKLFTPLIIVSYTRRYFLSKNKKFRITIDKNINYFNLKSKKLKEKNKEEEKIIIELKYNFNNEKMANKITKEIPFRLSANSKYVSGIQSFLS